MIQLPSVKRGDTFTLSLTLTDSNGDPIVGASINLESHIRDSKDQLISTMTIIESGSGVYDCSVNDTTSWPINQKLFCDIQYDDGSSITSTDTMVFFVEKDITHG